MSTRNAPGSHDFWQHGEQWTEAAAACTPEQLQQLADRLKQEADTLLRTQQAETMRLAQRLISLGGYPAGRGWQIAGNVHLIAHGAFDKALHAFDSAGRQFEQLALPLEQARTAVGRFAALTNLGRYQEAIGVGGQAIAVFEQHQADHDRARLLINMAWLHERTGDDQQALTLLDQARTLIDDHPQRLAGIEMNRANVLRNFGRFADSFAASRRAEQLFGDLNLNIEAARARWTTAITHFLQGDFQRALHICDEVGNGLRREGRLWDALMIELFAAECLLALRQFARVLEMCLRLEPQIAAHGAAKELSDVLLISVRAHVELGDFDGARRALMRAADLLTSEQNRRGLVEVMLQRAQLDLAERAFDDADARFEQCLQDDAALPLQQAQAALGQTEAAFAAGRTERAQQALRRADKLVAACRLPLLQQKAHHLRALLEWRNGGHALAAAAFEAAIETIDRLRAGLLLAWRGDFLADKDAVFADAVQFYLEQDAAQQALHTLQRAKSRSLIDLIGYRLDVRLRAVQPDDQPLIDRFQQLQADRNRLYRRAETERQMEKWLPQIAELEAQMMQLRQRLLLRHAAYRRTVPGAVQPVHLLQQAIEQDSVLLEYFFAGEQLHLFVIACDSINHYRLPATRAAIERLLTFFLLNVRSVTSNRALAAITQQQAQQLLQQLYQLLIAPAAQQLQAYKQLLIVPHNLLHYIPFHALYDGRHYLIEQHAISYLPSAAVLGKLQTNAVPAEPALVVGNTLDGFLANAATEAGEVAELLNTDALIDGAATTARVRALLPEAAIVHFATHGEFRADSPLFSGLSLADGQLTTIDIFNLELNAALVTLSACESGKQQIGGGDELLGLAQAFLSAGARSLLLTHWQVADDAMRQLMGRFYRHFPGQSGAAALRRAQIDMLRVPEWSHPYFWASCFMIAASSN